MTIYVIADVVEQLVQVVVMDDIEVVHEKDDKGSYAENFIAAAKKKNKENMSITLPGPSSGIVLLRR